jgi:hypothetical protein
LVAVILLGGVGVGVKFFAGVFVGVFLTRVDVGLLICVGTTGTLVKVT